MLCPVPFLPSSGVAVVKIFALRSKNFRESLEDDHPSLDGSRPKTASEDGAETVSGELDGLNARFGSAAEGLAGRLRQIGQKIQEEEEEEENQEERETDDGGSRRPTSRRPDVKVSAVRLRGASLNRARYIFLVISPESRKRRVNIQFKYIVGKSSPWEAHSL